MLRYIIAAVLMASAMPHAHAATVLITGSNRGLGFEFARQYAERGWTVIATARAPDGAKDLKDLAAKHSNVTIEKLDVTDDVSADLLAHKYKGKPIDVLINNAGVLGDTVGQTLGGFNRANFQEVMDTNVYGALAVSQAFRDNVIASKQRKLVAITSGAGIISTPVAGGNTYFYRASKAALNMVMRGLAGDLKDKGVVVGLVAPGAADTGMRRALVGDNAARDLTPAESVAGMIKVIDGLTPANSDKPLNYDGRVLPW